MLGANKKSALYVSAFLPSQNAPHAGGQAAYQNIIELRALGYIVELVVCTTEKIKYSGTESIEIHRQTKFSWFLGCLYRLVRRKYGYFLSWSYLNTRANIWFECSLRNKIVKNNYDLIYVDFTQSLIPVLDLIDQAKIRPILKCCVHDLYVQKSIRGGSFAEILLLGSVAKAEKNLLTKLDEIIVLSEKDKVLASTLYDLRKLKIRPWVPPNWVKSVNRNILTIVHAQILFFANFNRYENQEAASWFIKQAFPLVRNRIAHASLVIAGSGSENFNAFKHGQTIQIIGFLNNPGDCFNKCHIAIAPLAYGAGVKFKVLEALACGIVVVGTPVGLEGVPTDLHVVEATREAFVEAVVKSILS